MLVTQEPFPLIKTDVKKLKFLYYRLWTHFSDRRKKQIFLLIIFTLFSSFAEIISIGAIINSQPVIYAMPLNDRGEWTGAI